MVPSKLTSGHADLAEVETTKSGPLVQEGMQSHARDRSHGRSIPRLSQRDPSLSRANQGVGNLVSTLDVDLNAVPQIPPSSLVKDGLLIPTDLALSSSASSLESPGSDASVEDSASEIGSESKEDLASPEAPNTRRRIPGNRRDIPIPTGRVSGSST
ncbi:hypothetical protein NL676_012311 [Syzygium grande]|nr:hypothetical protein NL676_012311 [Syzygium grande]